MLSQIVPRAAALLQAVLLEQRAQWRRQINCLACFNGCMHLAGKRSGCAGGDTFNYQMGWIIRPALASNLAPPIRTRLVPTWTCRSTRGGILAGTFDGTTFRFYTNGVLAASATGILGPTNSVPFRIGTSGDCASFAGQLDEVRETYRAKEKKGGRGGGPGLLDILVAGR